MWLARASGLRHAAGALGGRRASAASLARSDAMCTEAFVGFAGGPVDRPARDRPSAGSEKPELAREMNDARSETPRRDAAAARAMVGGSGLNGFDRAWKKHTSASDCQKSHKSGSCSSARGFATERARAEWERLRARGEEINPCNSPAHPAAVAGVEGAVNPEKEQKSIQQSYDAHSQCFVCGNARPPPDGVGLRSFRATDEDETKITPSALRSEAVVGENFQGLPGIVSTGIMDALMICHGSWQSAIVLMDRAVTPRPPLVLTKTFAVTVRDRLPPGHAVRVTTKSVDVRDGKEPHAVKVVRELRAPPPGGEPFVCAEGEALYEKVGAVRSMW
jgi:hypothetical protein